jgi:hypothetical protein
LGREAVAEMRNVTTVIPHVENSAVSRWPGMTL